MRHLRAGDETMIGLLHLVAVHRIVEEVGEVREQIEVVADAVRGDAGRRVAVAAAVLPVGGPAVTIRVAAVGRIDRTEPADQAGADRAIGDLVGGIPLAVIAHRRQREAVDLIALAVAQHAVDLLVVIGMDPRTVVVRHFERGDHVAVSHLRRRGKHRALVAFAAHLDVCDRSLERVGVVDVRRPGGRKVALIRIVRTLGKLDAGHELGNHEIEVRVALAMCVGRHVHRHPRNRRREVGAVIEVEAAQEILIGLPFAAVLGDDQTRYRLEHLAVAHQRPFVNLPGRNRALTRGLRDPDQVLFRILDVREIREGALAGHGHIRTQRQVQHRVDLRDPGRRHVDRPPRGGKVNQDETDLVAARCDALEPKCATCVGDRKQRRPGRRAELDRHARQRTARFIVRSAGHRCRLSECVRRDETENEDGESQGCFLVYVRRRDLDVR